MNKLFHKLKHLLIKFLAVLNVSEGIIHLVGSAITLYGISKLESVNTWLIFVSPIENIIWGIFSLATGLILGKWHNQH